MNYRKYPNAIDKYRVNEFTLVRASVRQARVQRMDREAAVALASMFCAVAGIIITYLTSIL